MKRAKGRCRSSVVIFPISQAGRLTRLGTSDIQLSMERHGKTANFTLGLVMACDACIRIISGGLFSANLTAAVTMRRARRSWQKATKATSARFD